MWHRPSKRFSKTQYVRPRHRAAPSLGALDGGVGSRPSTGKASVLQAASTNFVNWFNTDSVVATRDVPPTVWIRLDNASNKLASP